MAKRYPRPPRKQRTREHVLADLSANHVEKIALQCGFAVERLAQNYGLDLAVFTFDKHGYHESGVLWMQLKATDHPKMSLDGKTVRVRLERRDILAWISEAYPVILVLYETAGDRAYYLSIQSCFASPAAFAKLRGTTVSVAIPTENLLNEKAMREFAQAKAAILAPEGD